MEDYQYVPLDPRAPSLRLLRLLKGDTIAIKCHIFHALISDPDTTSYEALSYVWGSTELVEHIEVDGRRLGITDNLYAALQNLRLADRDRILWVDAVCIDQSNTTERSQQVREMGRIFGSASRVIFWLGKPTVEVTLLMKTLAQLEVEYAAQCQRSALAIGAPMMMLQPAIDSLNDNLLARLRVGLLVLFERPWFERVWILQEVHNARSAVVYCGPLSISAEIFGLSPSLLAVSLSHKMHVQFVLEWMTDQVGLDARHQRPQGNSLMNLLTKFHAYKATDQRDMIFALLGISSEPVDHELLRPDYGKTLLQVVRNTVDYWFRWTTTSVEQILSFVHDFRGIRATYLVLPTKKRPLVSFSHDSFPYTRDQSFLYLGTDQEADPGELDIFHAELDRLQSRTKTYIEEGHAPIKIVPSPYRSSSATFLEVRDLQDALAMFLIYQCKHVFEFVGARAVYDRPELYAITMCQAAGVGSCYMVELLLGKQVDINWKGDSCGNALSAASESGHIDVVRMLLGQGANVNMKESSLGNALTKASEKGNEHIVQMLVDRGANVNPQGCACDTPLHLAVLHGHEKVVRILLDKGANVYAPGRIYDSVLESASARGDKQVVRMLLDAGADVNALGGRALYMASKHGHEKLVQMLLDNGANINAQETRQNGSALNAALNAGHENIVQMLLDNGVDVNMPGGPYYNALQLASAKGNEKMLQMLLKAGADVNAPGLGYGSALTLASEYRHKEIVKMLLEHGAKEGSEDREQSHISHG